MQKEYVIQFYKTINKLLCNLSFAGQYISHLILCSISDVLLIQGGESKGNFFMEQAKMTPRNEICDNTVSGISFLLC